MTTTFEHPSAAPGPHRIYLASASPRRRELLEQIGVRFDVIHAAVDETPQPGEAAHDYVARLALAKAWAGFEASYGARLVLGADTAVIVDEAILGKPRDRADALAMLERLSGRDHRVLSAVALVDGERAEVRVQASRVRLRALTAVECETYWASGEPADKAGAYAIQGKAAAFIEHLDGSYSGVMGLPLFETCELLREFGREVL